MKRILAMALLLHLSSFAWASGTNWQDNARWQSWPTVGQSSLSWLFLKIFQSELKTPSGIYLDTEQLTPQPLALSIVYQRDISSEDIIDATQQQWLKLGYQFPQHWLTRLQSILPDVKSGEKLVYITDGTTGEFHYFSANKDPAMVGEISDQSLNNALLAIWLSPGTEYPKHRKQLIGKRR